MDGKDEVSSEGISSHFSCLDESGSESGRLCEGEVDGFEGDSPDAW